MDLSGLVGLKRDGVAFSAEAYPLPRPSLACPDMYEKIRHGERWTVGPCVAKNLKKNTKLILSFVI